MVSKYRRKKDHGNLPHNMYDYAIQAVVDGGKVATAAKDFGIQHVTLICKVMNSRNVTNTVQGSMI